MIYSFTLQATSRGGKSPVFGSRRGQENSLIVERPAGNLDAASFFLQSENRCALMKAAARMTG
jgi:hypothetical protein